MGSDPWWDGDGVNFRVHVRRLANNYKWDDSVRVGDNEDILTVARQWWGDGYEVTTEGEVIPPVPFQRDTYEWGRNEPRVDVQSRDSIIRWLVWNDRNGCYSDEDRDAEYGEGERLTLETAQEALKEAYYQSTGEEITL